MNKKTTKRKNPLYVVSKKGKVVEEASSAFDSIIKKLNLAPLITMLNSIIDDLLKSVKNYAMLLGVSEIINNLFNLISSFFMSGNKSKSKTQTASSNA